MRITQNSVWIMWHDDVIKWKHFPRYWFFVRGIHRSPVRRSFDVFLVTFSLICAWTNGWVNNREAGELTRHCAHYNVTVMDMLSCRIQHQWKHFIIVLATPYAMHKAISTSAYFGRVTPLGRPRRVYKSDIEDCLLEFGVKMAKMTLKIKVNDPYFQYQPKIS